MLETIWNSILPNILEIVFTIISLIVSCYVVPYIKNDLIPWLKEKHLYNTVKNFVQAAEKLAESGTISKDTKKEKVVELLQNNGITINATTEAIIESCVKELDMITSVVVDEVIKADTEEDENAN